MRRLLLPLLAVATLTLSMGCSLTQGVCDCDDSCHAPYQGNGSPGGPETRGPETHKPMPKADEGVKD